MTLSEQRVAFVEKWFVGLHSKRPMTSKQMATDLDALLVAEREACAVKLEVRAAALQRSADAANEQGDYSGNSDENEWAAKELREQAAAIRGRKG